MRLHEHLLYAAHECDDGCPVNPKCKNKGNIVDAKQPRVFENASYVTCAHTFSRLLQLVLFCHCF